MMTDYIFTVTAIAVVALGLLMPMGWRISALENRIRNLEHRLRKYNDGS